jgi:hypothetical protein
VRNASGHDSRDRLLRGFSQLQGLVEFALLDVRQNFAEDLSRFQFRPKQDSLEDWDKRALIRVS